jgi:diguanylate cyclase (GGDEF)-like protein
VLSSQVPFTLFLRVVSAAGMALLVALLVLTTGSFGPLDAEFWVLAGLVLAGELFPIQVHGQVGEETFSTPFGFAILLLYGVPEVAVVQVASSLAADLIRRRPADRIVFNLAQLTLSWAAAGAALELLGGSGLGGGEILSGEDLPAIVVSAVVFFAANSTLVRTAEALLEHIPILAHLRADLLFRSWSAGTLFALGPPVAVVADQWLYLVPALALPMAAVHRASEQASEMERLALYDRLTALPNRTLLSQLATQAIRRASTDRLGVGLLTLDLDRFRDVNDTLGRAQGDALLLEMADRLSRCLRSGDTVARVGGDKFGVLLPGISGRQDAEGAARKILKTLTDPIEVAGATLSVDGSVGIACFPDDGADAELLLQRADAAMYAAKRAQSRLEFYGPQMDAEAPRRLMLVTRLKQAIDAGSIELYYQPKIALEGRGVAGVEALSRWDDSALGRVPPSTFVPLAETTGLIAPFTELTLELAARDCRRWQDEGCPLSIALNVSTSVLTDPDFPAAVQEQLQRFGLGPGALEIEITESMMLGDHAHAREALAELRSIGVRAALDDFGTGFSSFAYLRELPVYALKIDRSFIRALDVDPDSEAIVRSIIELARNLGLETVAEGVEGPDGCDRLATLGCDYVQGFALARPMSADGMLEWMRARERRALGR